MPDNPYKPISDEAIEKRLIHLPAEIKQLSYKVIALKMVWINAKAEYKRNFSKAINIEKATNDKLTQTDLKAMAEEQTYDELLKVNIKEAAYRNALADRDELKDGLSSLEDVSSNRRASGFQQRHQI